MYKQCCRCSELKLLSEFHKDKHRKDGMTSACKVCRTLQVVEYHKKNETWKKESYKKYQKKRMSTQKAKQSANHASTKYFHLNKDKTVPYNRANSAHRRVNSKYPECMTCSLLDILPIYEKAYKMELETGITHHVDHIIPLQAGGLHHPTNLSILTENDHKEKTNTERDIIKKLLKEYYLNDPHIR